MSIRGHVTRESGKLVAMGTPLAELDGSLVFSVEGGLDHEGKGRAVLLCTWADEDTLELRRSILFKLKVSPAEALALSESPFYEMPVPRQAPADYTVISTMLERSKLVAQLAAPIVLLRPPSVAPSSDETSFPVVDNSTLCHDVGVRMYLELRGAPCVEQAIALSRAVLSADFVADIDHNPRTFTAAMREVFGADLVTLTLSPHARMWRVAVDQKMMYAQLRSIVLCLTLDLGKQPLIAQAAGIVVALEELRAAQDIFEPLQGVWTAVVDSCKALIERCMAPSAGPFYFAVLDFVLSAGNSSLLDVDKAHIINHRAMALVCYEGLDNLWRRLDISVAYPQMRDIMHEVLAKHKVSPDFWTSKKSRDPKYAPFRAIKLVLAAMPRFPTPPDRGFAGVVSSDVSRKYAL